jgi:hypothetical protein
MRNMDTAYNHEPLWRADFLDHDGMLVETWIVDERARAELMRNWELYGPGPSACAFRLVSLNENIGGDDAAS